MINKKKILCSFLVLSLLCGCGGTTSKIPDTTSGVNDVLKAQMEKEDALKDYISSADDTTENGSANVPEGSTSQKSAPSKDSVSANDAVSADNIASPDDSTPARQTGLNDNAPLPEEDADANKLMGSTEGVDVDLTVLSSTMVYSEVYNIMVSPEEYVGKTIKMRGSYSGFYDSTTDNYYFTCIIQDATACCSQGIEFVLTDDYVYPDDYPYDGDMITVVGVFDTYIEGDYMYCTLRDARLL